MIDTLFRPKVQSTLIEPLAKPFTKLPPALLTTIALLLGLAIIPALATNQPIAATALLALSGLFDTLDGTVARLQQRASSKGAAFDILSDRIVEFSAIFGLYLVEPSSRATLSILMLGSTLLCITSFLVVGIFTENESEKSFHYSSGIMERTEAFIFFALMMLWPVAFNILGTAFVLLVAMTGLWRIFQFSLTSVDA